VNVEDDNESSLRKVFYFKMAHGNSINKKTNSF
jgi:hypothetical protein